MPIELRGNLAAMLTPAQGGRRETGDLAAIPPSVRQAIADVYPNHPLATVTTAESHMHALAIEDDNKRAIALKFLVKAGWLRIAMGSAHWR